MQTFVSGLSVKAQYHYFTSIESRREPFDHLKTLLTPYDEAFFNHFAMGEELSESPSTVGEKYMMLQLP
jgi:hypothetical protein